MCGGDAVLGGKLPAFFFHFLVRPVLQVFEEGGFDHSEANPDAALIADPHEASFCQKNNLAVGQDEAYIQRAGEAQRLFEAVRGGRLAVAVRRQVVLGGRFIADLYVPALKLVVEVDGGYHAARSAHDAKRDRALARAGYHVLRLEAVLVTSDLHAAVALFAAEIERLRTPLRGVREALATVPRCARI